MIFYVQHWVPPKRGASSDNVETKDMDRTGYEALHKQRTPILDCLAVPILMIWVTKSRPLYITPPQKLPATNECPLWEASTRDLYFFEDRKTSALE